MMMNELSTSSCEIHPRPYQGSRETPCHGIMYS